MDRRNVSEVWDDSVTDRLINVDTVPRKYGKKQRTVLACTKLNFSRVSAFRSVQRKLEEEKSCDL